ncbi:Dedicator of cytokinesis protein 3 [Varanus komodoensis]|nr:Dedicator of cytokinesis protein 3 [Varanus komodoensis]
MKPRIEEMPFDGTGLFHQKTNCKLKAIHESHLTAHCMELPQQKSNLSISALFRPPQPTTTLYTNASLLGWGAACLDFGSKVWNSYFSLSVLFINQPSLQLETVTPAKRKKILDKYGDMRVMMAYELFSMWQNLGEHKIHFIPGMIGPFLGVTLVPQPEVRNIMIPIFHDMMDWEQRKNGNFKQVEAELIDKLDSLVSEGKGDENYRELFSLLLLEKIEQETWRETGLSFVTSVTRLMERLLDYRDCMKGDETENKKIGCTVNLMNFYKSEINKEEMYIRYIHKLCDMHLQAENFTEAAFTLLLYCELLQWEDRPLREFLHYPSQTEWQRKEGLCRKIIHYFNKGKSWEFGIPLCRELAIQYEILYDYQSLSWIRKMEATYYDNIMEQQRLEPEFFRVGFYGRKFPFFLRNKEYICRGHDYERLEAFQQRMLSEFPQAIAMQHPNHPDDSILQCDAQYLQIYAVTPIPDNIDVLQMDRVPDRIKSFYRVNNIRKFRYDRPFHKGPKDKENEFKVEVSPLENAIQVVENKNQELRTLISQYQHKQMHGNINLLSMCLNGVIDAAVNVLMKGAGLTTLEAEALYLSTEQIQHGRQPCKLPHTAPTNVPHLCPGGTTSRGSPSLPDKYRHTRELMMLLPTHRDRPSSALYPATIMENGQLFQQHQAAGVWTAEPERPCHSCLPMLGASWPHQYLPEAYPMSPLHPIPASPTSPQSGLDGSNSTLSGSASSGVSSLSESNFGHSSEPPPRTDTMDSVPSQAWNTDEDLETPYLPVRYSLSEPDVLETLKSQPCRSHSAPSGVIPQDAADPPALPPKPYHSRLPNMDNEESMILEEEEKHRALHRKISQPASGAKEEQARVAWEHGISEQ